MSEKILISQEYIIINSSSYSSWNISMTKDSLSLHKLFSLKINNYGVNTWTFSFWRKI